MSHDRIWELQGSLAVEMVRLLVNSGHVLKFGLDKPTKTLKIIMNNYFLPSYMACMFQLTMVYGGCFHSNMYIYIAIFINLHL